MWFDVTAWRGLAEYLAENVVKGQEFHLYGEIFTEEYEDREGNKRTSTKVEALAIAPIPRRDGPSSPSSPTPSASGDAWPAATPQTDEPPF
jgi:single-strand DNA-binding protein